MDWEKLGGTRSVLLRRRGRFLVAELAGPHRTFSTSARNGGQVEHVRFLLNHQSCEGSAHEARFELIGDEARYHGDVCAEIGLPAEATAVMSTAANMNYAAIRVERDRDMEVLAAVTAGVETNATCAGDPGGWAEQADGSYAGPPDGSGTINIMLLLSEPVTPAAQARIAGVMTEAKAAALRRLAAPSRYSQDLATGTGTDQFCIAAPLEGATPRNGASPHTKLGEAVGVAVRDAVLEALRWQNGLEPSMTRGLVHALGRFGFSQASAVAELEGMLSAADFALLKTNANSVFHEPLAGAAAHALAAVLDRARHGGLPDADVREAVVGQAALLATKIAAKPESWAEHRRALLAMGEAAPMRLVTAAIGLGWSAKWRG